MKSFIGFTGSLALIAALTACTAGSGTNPPPPPVPPPPPPGGTIASVTLIPSTNFNLGIGSKFTFAALAKDASGNKVNTSPTWNSSDPSKASINSAGQLEGLAAGTTQVAATAGGKTSAPLTVTVVSNPGGIASISYDILPSFVDVGTPLTLKATARNASGSPIAGVTLAFYSERPEVATVEPNTGVVTLIAPGQLSMNASLPVLGSRTPGFNVTSPSQVLSKICINSSTCQSPYMGSLGSIESAFAIPFDAQNILMNPDKLSFSWSSSSPAVVQVTPQSAGSARAEFKYLAKGSSTVTAVSGGVTGTLVVNVP
jgi:uncharacterized protein YjdB